MSLKIVVLAKQVPDTRNVGKDAMKEDGTINRAALPAKKRTPDAAYAARLACCKACDALNAGTCMQCGCYVEMRAARLDMHCPKEGQW